MDREIGWYPGTFVYHTVPDSHSKTIQMTCDGEGVKQVDSCWECPVAPLAALVLCKTSRWETLVPRAREWVALNPDDYCRVPGAVANIALATGYPSIM